MGYGDLAFGPPHETMRVRKYDKQITPQLNANMRERIGIGQWLNDMGVDQRNWTNNNLRPIERSLSEVLRKRLSGANSDQVAAGAMQNVGDAYSRAGETADREAARYGVNIDPQLKHGFGVNKTRDAVFAGNLAVQADRDAAVQDAYRFSQNGTRLPGIAAQEYAAGAGTIVDQKDYDTGQLVGKANSEIDALHQIASAFADGGTVKADFKENPATVWLRDFLTGSRNPISTSINVNEHRELTQESGGAASDKPDTTIAERSGYASGGKVGFGVGRIIDGSARRVDLETDDFIVPKAAVDKYGRDFWDKMVAEHGGNVADIDAGENETRAESNRETGYAGGGAVGFGIGAGIEDGYNAGAAPIFANIRKGLAAGIGDSRAEEEHQARMEDVTARRNEMAYQRELRGAMSRFAASDGTDPSPILDLQGKYFGGKERYRTVPNDNGTFKLLAVGQDGTERPIRDMTLDETRKFGVTMAEALSDPKSARSLWSDEKPDRINTPYGSVTHVKDRNGKWGILYDNNSDLRAQQGPRGGKNDYLGWKDHNQLNDDVSKTANTWYKTYDVMGNMIDPNGPAKSQMFMELAVKDITALGKSPRELTSEDVNGAYSRAKARVDSEFMRRGAKGIKGAGGMWFSDSDADKAAADMANYFPNGGSEPEMRAFMARNKITDKANQDQVISKMRAYQGAPTGQAGGFGVGANPSASVSPGAAQPPGKAGRSPDQVKADYKSGRITREQAVGELKQMGFQ